MANDARSSLDGPRSPIDLEAVVRTASYSDSVPLRHPTPDLQSLQGAYIQNVERLEEKAERMSMGSNVAEEIRKLHIEQKLGDGQRESVHSNYDQTQDETTGNSSGKRQSWEQRPRNISTSSYSNSIVEVNTAARYGGYSPGGYVGSPKGSLRSGSWSQVSHGSIPRPRSASRGSRLGQVTSPDYEMEMVDSPVEEPTLQPTIPRLDALRITNDTSFSDMFDQFSNEHSSNGGSPNPSRMPSDGSFTKIYNQLAEANHSQTHISAPRIPSDTSFTDVYNQIASEIEQELDNAAGEPLSPAANSSIQHTPVEEQKPFFGRATPDTTRAFDEAPAVPPHASESLLPQESADVETRQPEDQSLEAQAPPVPAHTVLIEDVDGDHGPMHLLPPEEYPDRPTTAASTDTYQQAQTLFQDFDGTHCAPSIYEGKRGPSGGSNRPPSMLKELDHEASGIPPPHEGMTYYPAPVPRMLNLPQRLSQLPSSTVHAKRRTQMLSGLPADVRKSAPWLAAPGAAPDKRLSSATLLDQRRSRMSMANMASLPPQLRASMFFEHPGLEGEVQIKNGSAVATLDEMLDAAAQAPVSAFTDHPIVGHIGAEVYRKAAKKSTPAPQKQDAEQKTEEAKKRRSSFLGLRRKSVTVEEELDAKRPPTPGTPGKIQKRKSRSFSLNKLDDAALARGPDGEIIGGEDSNDLTPHENPDDIEEAIEPDDEEDEQQEEEGEPEYVGPPTTLLAELQLRKAQQKSRTRTAATAFPNGMHSTLLELDAVAQLESQKRKKTRVALAWEDPETHARFDEEQNDEDVPLGLLFPGKQKNDPRDANRPLGLLEKRELEENEPLSNRRNRILGIDPKQMQMQVQMQAPAVQVNGIEQEEDQSDEEDEGETLGQRMQRLRDKKELDEALGDVEARPISQAFSVEMLNELGVEAKDDKGKKRDSTGSQAVETPDRSGSNTPVEEETLGQRRKRLQQEALEAARLGNRASTMPGVRPSRSMADLLSAFPQGEHASKRLPNANLLDSAHPDSLLRKNAEEQDFKRQTLLETNKRSTSHGLDRPLVDVPDEKPELGDRKKSGGFKNGIYNTGTGGVTPQASQSQSNLLGMQGGMPELGERKRSGGFMGGIYNTGTGGVTPQASQSQSNLLGMQGGIMDPNAAYYGQPGYNSYGNMAYTQPGVGFGQMGYGGMQGYGMGAMGMNMNMGYPTNMLYPGAAGAGMQMGLGSTPNLLPQTQNRQSTVNLTSISSTNLLANMGGALHGNLRPGGVGANAAYQRHSTFSAFPTVGMTGTGLGMQMQDANTLDEKSRSRIDAWRQSVMQ
jgi:hypothetical protein